MTTTRIPIWATKTTMPKHDCKGQHIPPDVCYLLFTDIIHPGEVHHSKDFGYTIRGEMVIVDYNNDGKIIGIELVNPDIKPCQQ